MINGGIWRRDSFDSEDDDSIMSPRQAQPYEVMRLAARNWSSMNDGMKGTWKTRVIRLNNKPRNDGEFEEVPPAIRSCIDGIVKQSLTQEWRAFAGDMRRAIVTNDKRRLCQFTEYIYKFGEESVILGAQTYRSFFLSHHLKITIFGSPLLCTLSRHEVAHRTKKQTILHFYSHQRLSKLLTFGGLCAASVEKDNKIHKCAPKMNLKRRETNQHIIGYAMEENGDIMRVFIEGEDDLIDVNRPVYNALEGQFQFRAQTGRYTVTEFWPVRMKLKQSGNSSYIISVNIVNESEE